MYTTKKENKMAKKSLYESVAEKIAKQVGGTHYIAANKESWVVESKHKKDWTVDYAVNEANNDPNQRYVLEPYDEYKLLVSMHIVEAQKHLRWSLV
jgi:hypothetical protein